MIGVSVHTPCAIKASFSGSPMSNRRLGPASAELDALTRKQFDLYRGIVQANKIPTGWVTAPTNAEIGATAHNGPRYRS
jgi:hypothetical protein